MVASCTGDTADVVLVFRLCCAHTRFGESIRVVGSIPELGAWSPEQASCMLTDTENYPEWISGRIRIAACQGGQTKLKYKYVRDLRTLGEGFVWEEQIANREVEISLIPGSSWEVRDSAFDEGGCPKAVESLRADLPPDGAEQIAGQVQVCFGDSYVFVGDDPLGTGAFSSVWRCRLRTTPDSTSVSTSVDRAVKKISKKGMSRVAHRFLFGQGTSKGELELHKCLHHPNVVELLDVFEDAGSVSMVLEFCAGGDILQLVRAQKAQHGAGLPELAAVAVARQLLAALDYLHAGHVVHRDVKCENVFQLEDHTVAPEDATFKLGDFGFAARILPDEVLLEPVGSPSTAAPEVTCGRPYAKPADVWSAGATLFTALAGRRMRAMVEVDGLAAKPQAFLGMLMQSDAAKRPTAAEAREHDWLRR